MIKLDYNLDVCCKKCESIIKLKLKEKDFTSSYEERSAGYETEHTYTKVENCPVCANKMIIGIHIYEYPSTIENHEEVFGEGYFKDHLLNQITKIEKNARI